MSEGKQRIKGYDVARALAVFIMIIVNFNLVLATTSDHGILQDLLEALQGKGATLFIVLAGVGISLMVNSTQKKGVLLQEKQWLLIKRAIFLFVFGLMFTPLWPADILHYYGFYISIGVLLIPTRSSNLWLFIGLLIICYPVILSLIDYETGWNWETNEYTGFWTLAGFTRNLFINGFHPVIPWVAFILAGMWLGKQNLASPEKRKPIMWLSTVTLIFTQVLSYCSIKIALSVFNIPTEEALASFGTNPMPPMPLFMISGISWSFMIITCCIWATQKWNKTNSWHFLVKTGQMAFTHYILHVAVGILGASLLFGENNLSKPVTFLYATSFCAISVLCSVFWYQKFTRGPMSLFMRAITG